MKIGSTIIVLILATAGVVAMLRVGWDDAARKAPSSSSQRLLASSPLPIDDLTRITLRQANEPAMAFIRRGMNWSQAEPFDWPMDPYAVRQLAQQARELEVFDAVDPSRSGGGLSSEALGLNPPVAEIAYEWDGGALTLQLGRRSVAGRAYVRIKGDEKVYIVDQKLHERAIEMDHKEWRSRTIFENAGVESSRIEWSNGPVRVVLARERKQWTMTAPAKTRLDGEARDQFMDAIGRAQVSGFILDQPTDNDLAKFGLKDSPVSLMIASNDQVQRLIIGSRAGGGTQDYFGMIESRAAVVRISGAVLAALFRRPQDLAALTASGVIAADVKSIVIRTANEELKLERELEKWRANSTRDVNAAHVQELLDQMTTLRASGVELMEYPRELEKATITLHGFDGKAIDTVRVVFDEKAGKWGMENGDNVLRVYPPGLKLRLTAADFGLE